MSNIILNGSKEIAIKKINHNKLAIELDKELFNMLIIECKFIMHRGTFGRSEKDANEFIKKNLIVSTLAGSPLADEIPFT